MIAQLGRPTAILAIFSLMLFVVSATTFNALGVVLPLMVRDLGWSWSQAGLGFTFLGACCGGGALLPAILIRRLSLPVTLIIGVTTMAAGFTCLFMADNIALYYLGAALTGLGYVHTAFIPATHALGQMFRKRALPFGIYFTVGAVGGVAGPWSVMASLAVTPNWRLYWLMAAVAVALAGLLCALATSQMKPLPAEPAAAPAPGADKSRIHRTDREWTVKEALRTPQYFVLVAAYASQLLCASTVASLSVAHLQERGASAALAGGLLSLQAFIAAASKLGAGFLGDRMEPKGLLMAALASLTVGLAALGIGSGAGAYAVYAVGVGLGYGVTVLATTILLLNYFGSRHNLELFSIMCLSGTAAALGPTVGGLLRDGLGGFSEAFLLFAAVIGVVLLGVVAMRPPQPAKAAQAAAAPKPVLAAE